MGQGPATQVVESRVHLVDLELSLSYQAGLAVFDDVMDA